MTTQNIIDAWDSGVEPYNATTEQDEIDRLFSSLNHIGYSAVTGPIDKPCQCDFCKSQRKFPTS